MDGFPTSDEEFELMYGDELELIREQEDFNKQQSKSRKSLQFDTSDVQQNKIIQKSQTINHENSLENDFVPITEASQDLFGSLSNPTQNSLNNTEPVQTRKRTIQELFGDIDDLLDKYDYEKVKKKKVDNQLQIIDKILELRQQASNRNNLVTSFSKNYTEVSNDHINTNVSRRVPKFPFIPITNHKKERIYIRCHSESYQQEETMQIGAKYSFAGVMGGAFRQVWYDATNLLSKTYEDDECTIISDVSVLEADNEENSLWVELYKPKKYLELLSDESTNRTLLKWIKLWDRIVFNRRPKLKQKKAETKIENKFQRQEFNLKLAEDGRPEYKVALLCGPPGLGKTTLAHMVAKHAGYNVVEVNASDDRNLENFKTSLENSTQMRSYVDQEKRPNCLVFDEIDGAPPTSIDYLVKFISGTAITKSKKNAKKQKPHVLKRPIICICNDVYVPALRALRQIAFVVNFPPTGSTRLAERLNEISKYQNITTNLSVLLALCEKTHNDIRSCLSALHFFKSQNKTLTLSDVYKRNIGQKDMQKGLFNVWQDIFCIEHKINRQQEVAEDHLSLKTRMKNILSSVLSFGDYERLGQGVFENFIQMKVKTTVTAETCEALEWFCFNDIINTEIQTTQNYELLSYMPYAFVVWHFVFASLSWQKLTYPSVGTEVRGKIVKLKALIAEVLKSMAPSSRVYSNSSTLILDLLPLISKIIEPAFRPVNLHLYTEQEKQQLANVVSIMIDYNLNYVQERTPEGNYVYNLDPNIDDVISFPCSKLKKSLSYFNKQLLAREIEMEKMRRINGVRSEEVDKRKDVPDAKGKNLPNHLQTLKAKVVAKTNTETIITKDFFGRTITTKQNNDVKSHQHQNKSHIWYHFKEGYSNAVRKKIKVVSLK